MAEASKQSNESNPVPHEGDHDRVVMLSLKADGTADQHNPEVIGDKETAVRAAKEQFAQQSVAAVDIHRNARLSDVTLVGQKDGSVKEEPLRADEDPSIREDREAKEKAAKASESAAEKTINSLHKG